MIALINLLFVIVGGWIAYGIISTARRGRRSDADPGSDGGGWFGADGFGGGSGSDSCAGGDSGGGGGGDSGGCS